MTARSLGEAVPALTHKIVMAPGKKYSATVSAHTRVLLTSASRARSCAPGPPAPGSTAPTPTPRWTPGSTAASATSTEREAARDLALRWLHAFGPGTATDLQWWTGWTGRHHQAGAGRLRRGRGAASTAARPGSRPATRSRSTPAEPWVALLPGLDPTTMGWKERAWYLPDACADTFDRMGNAGPTIWVDGAGRGRLGAGRRRRDPDARYFVDVPAAPTSRGRARAPTSSPTLLGDTRFTVRFPSPVSAALFKGTSRPDRSRLTP